MQVLKDRIAWLEATNEDLSRELGQLRNKGDPMEQYEAKTRVC